MSDKAMTEHYASQEIPADPERAAERLARTVDAWIEETQQRIEQLQQGEALPALVERINAFAIHYSPPPQPADVAYEAYAKERESLNAALASVQETARWWKEGGLFNGMAFKGNLSGIAFNGEFSYADLREATGIESGLGNGSIKIFMTTQLPAAYEPVKDIIFAHQDPEQFALWRQTRLEGQTDMQDFLERGKKYETSLRRLGIDLSSVQTRIENQAQVSQNAGEEVSPASGLPYLPLSAGAGMIQGR